MQAPQHTHCLYLIISVYILTVLVLWNMFSKGHVTVTSCLFSDTSQCKLFQASEFFCKKTPWMVFQDKTPFQGWILLDMVLNTRLITTLKNVDMFILIEVNWFMHSAFCGWKRSRKFHYAFFGKWFRIVVRDFQNGCKYSMLQNVSINFLLFYKNNLMLKSDIMLDYC